jgi:hypothetical protein
MESNPRAISIHPCELLKAERKNLILSPKEGSRGVLWASSAMFQIPDLLSKSRRHLGEGGSFRRRFLASIVPGERDLAFRRPQSRTRDLKLVELVIRRRFRAVGYDVMWLCVVTSTVPDRSRYRPNKLKGSLQVIIIISVTSRRLSKRADTSVE